MKAGEVILSSGSGLISHLIKHAQKGQTVDGKPSRWSHAAIVLDPAHAMESTIDWRGNGIRITPMSHFKGATLLIPQQRGLQLSPVAASVIVANAYGLFESGKRYPVAGLIGSLLAYRFGWKSNPLQTKHALYCSAFVQECYDSVGFDFNEERTARNTSPEMIWRYALKEGWGIGVVG